jgi:hypothetical protein
LLQQPSVFQLFDVGEIAQAPQSERRSPPPSPSTADLVALQSAPPVDASR